MAIALDSAPFWTAACDAPRLELDRLRAATGLMPAPDQRSAVAAIPSAVRCSLLPVVIGGRRFGLPLPLVERVAARTSVARLPACGGRPSKLSGAVAVDGRAVPMTDGGVWLGLGEDGLRAIHVLIRPNKQRHVLAVDAVDRPVALDASRLQPLRDPAERLTGLAHLADEVLPVLDVSRIGAAA